MQKSKISRFPREIRDEVNRRLDQSEKQKPIINWLNSLPEVQEILKSEFEGEPVKRQNLESWRKTGFQAWQIRQSALDFTENSLPDDLDQSVLEKMSAKLIRCLQIRYAAVAGSLPPVHDNPEVELRRLGELCDNLTALRRGDLSAERLSVERERLALEKSRSESELNRLFWEWTKRSDIQQKLYPNRDPDKIRREVDRIISHKMLGIPIPNDALDETTDPAILI
jgi:hypothetical protein